MTTTTSKPTAPPPQTKTETKGKADMAEQQGQGASQGQAGRKTGAAQNGTKAANAKDPLRPRRKKAKRACFACQRAHLTCGMYILSFPCLLQRRSSPSHEHLHAHRSRTYLYPSLSISCKVEYGLTDDIARRRATLPTMYQARPSGRLPGRCSQKGQIPA